MSTTKTKPRNGNQSTIKAHHPIEKKVERTFIHSSAWPTFEKKSNYGPDRLETFVFFLVVRNNFGHGFRSGVASTNQRPRSRSADIRTLAVLGGRAPKRKIFKRRKRRKKMKKKMKKKNKEKFSPRWPFRCRQRTKWASERLLLLGRRRRRPKGKLNQSKSFRHCARSNE